jgi:peptide/nickel transport system ATP-binding protein
VTRTPLLDVENLRIWFRQYDRGLRRRTVVAVDGMDLSVAAGEVVALVGASGAGKSLLAHGVLGLLPPNAHQEGVVRWRGEPLPPRERAALAGRTVALLPQTLTALDPTATVRAQARRSATVLGRAPADGIAAVRAERLDQAVDRRYPHQLSGGMGRRVLTAMALLGDPDLVIADEPTPGLAAPDVTRVLRRLRAMADDDGRGVLLITHDISAAVEVADRVVVCRAGRTVDEAPAAAFTGTGVALEHPYTRALWEALPENRPQWVERTAGVPC